MSSLLVDILKHPGLLYVAATLLPLAVFVILLVVGVYGCSCVQP